MISIVKCNKKMCVQLPDTVTAKAGDVIRCPQSCIFKSGFCSKISSFNAVSVILAEESKAAVYKSAKYSDGEVSSIWGVQPAVPSAQPPAPSAPSIQTQTNSTADVQTQTQTAAQNSTVKHRSTFGSRLRTESNGSEADKILKPEKEYQKFILGGKIFSDDQSVRAAMRTQPLKNALWEIFTYWEIRSVFKNSKELRDEFIWLLTSATKRSYKKSEVDAVLSQEEYTMPQKFFYLFYDAVFRYEPPKGFYWCDNNFSMQPLIAVFKDKRDFIRLYCDSRTQGERFRIFFRQHKKEIFHFLGIDDEIKLFEDMTLALAKQTGEIVLIDKVNDYAPLKLGSIQSFIANMQYPCGNCVMDNMVKFLKNYRVTKMGVVPRTIAFPFIKSEKGGLTEDKDMYAALGLSASSSYASEYDNFTTLLSEYVREFNPERISVGSLSFTKSNFSEEIEEIVKDHCKTLFGKVDEEVAFMHRARAWLAKSLYERKILCTFNVENKPHIDELMKLIAEPDINNKVSRYISLYAVPVIQVGFDEYDVHEYIGKVLDEEQDVYTICGIFSGDYFINGFFASRIKGGARNLNELFKKYQEQFQAFNK